MDDLAAFYAARLDETQQLAEAYLQRRHAEGTDRETWAYKLLLREVEAGRKLLARYIEVQSWSYPPADGDDAIRDELDLILRIKAAVYDSHPDYDEAWKP
jgi:hypothetical protein